MPPYTINDAGVAHARELIDARHYELHKEWSEAAPSSEEANAEIERHGYEGYGRWHLALDTEASEETKDRYGFPYGDFQRLNRAALIHAKQRAAQNGHDGVAGVADQLLRELDEQSAGN